MPHFGGNLTCKRVSTAKKAPKKINQQLRLISRIVIHPKYRSIGLGEKLIKDSLPLAGTPCVEMIAVMPKYNPFAERSDLRKITLKEPPPAATKIAAELEKLGFDLHFLASQHYVSSKLEGLTDSQLAELKELFKRNGHPMFKEIFGAVRHKGRINNNYGAELEKANMEKLTRLIKTTGILVQTKVYLFWRIPD